MRTFNLWKKIDGLSKRNDLPELRRRRYWYIRSETPYSRVLKRNALEQTKMVLSRPKHSRHRTTDHYGQSEHELNRFHMEISGDLKNYRKRCY